MPASLHGRVDLGWGVAMTEQTTRARRVGAAVAAYAICALGFAAWLRARLLDDRLLESQMLELSWQLQLPWRAAHGEWVGRDFHYPLGPLYQWIALAGGGFGFHSPGAALAGYDIGFGLVALAASAFVAVSAASRPWPRVAVFAALVFVTLFGPVAAVRGLCLVLVVVLYAADDDRDAPSPRRALAVGAALGAGMLVSYERGVMGVVALVAMAGYEVLVRRTAGASPSPAVRRLALAIAACLLVQLALAALAALAGADYFEYLAQQMRLARSYTLAMAAPGEPDSLSGPMALVLCAAALALLLASARARDPVAGCWLVGTFPSLVAALVRTDPSHVWLALVPPVTALVAVAARQHERGRWRLSLAAALPVALLLLAWLGSHPMSVRAHGPELAWQIARHLRGDLVADAAYQGTLTRTVAFVRERKSREGIACVGLHEGADGIHAIVDVPGPTETTLRWSPGIQEELAERIVRDRCPYFVQRLCSFAFEGCGWAFGPDALAVARLYEPDRPLGPDTWALRLRDRPAPARETALRLRRGGGVHEIALPGTVSIELDRPVPAEHLIAFDYTLTVPGWQRFVGGTPVVRVTFGDTDGRAFPALYMTNLEVGRRARGVLPVHAEAAERRFYTGIGARNPRQADRVAIDVVPQGHVPPRHARLEIHGVREVAPGAPARPPDDPGACVPEADLLALVERGDAMPRAMSPIFEGGSMFVHPNPFPEAQAEVFVPLMPCADRCLHVRGRVSDPGRGDGVRLEVHVLDREVRTLVADEPLGVARPSVALELDLQPWHGRDVLIRLGVEPNASSDFDWTWIDELRVGACSETTVASLVRAGAAIYGSDARPILEGRADVFLHANGAGQPEASVGVPITPRPDACFVTGLRVRPAPEPGDGVTFFAEARSASATRTLFERFVPQDRAVPQVEVPLEPLSGREVVLWIGTRPRGDAAYDWALFEAPRVTRCASR